MCKFLAKIALNYNQLLLLHAIFIPEIPIFSDILSTSPYPLQSFGQ